MTNTMIKTKFYNLKIKSRARETSFTEHKNNNNNNNKSECNFKVK